MIRPTFIQCFSHPFSRHWPSTGNPVTSECRQLYALVAICCCVRNTHLLVLHESPSLNTSMVTSMPKGPKYLDFRITTRTTGEDFCSFLVRAQLAATTPPMIPSPIVENLYSPVSPGGDLGRQGRTGSVLASPPPHPNSSASHRPGVVVVCLHGIAEASDDVRSAIMDILTCEQVRSNRRAVKTATLRLVVFCNYKDYTRLLPESLRSAFALSTYVSALSSDSAVVLQTALVSTSNIVNKRFMLELMTAPDGAELLETVTLSSSVARYLRHLVLVVRGSAVTCLPPGTNILRWIPRWLVLLRAAAALFMPDEELLKSRSLPFRSAAMQVFGRASDYLLDRHATPTSRGSSTLMYPSRPTHPADRAEATVSRRVSLSDGGEPVGYKATEPHTASTSCDASSGEIKSLSHVVVSPSDVVCLIMSLITHHMTLPREFVPSSDVLEAINTMTTPNLGSVAGTTKLRQVYEPLLAAHVIHGRVMNIQDAGVWDAVAASWQLRHGPQTAFTAHRRDPHGTVGGGLENSLLSNPTKAERSFQGRGASSVQSAGSGYSSVYGSPIRTLFSGDSPRRSMSGHRGLTGAACSPLLNYCEIRELIRATLVCRSAPAPG